MSNSSFSMEKNAPWLKDSASPKLLDWLEKVMKWRHFEAGLSGSDSRYDQALGFYGNPKARVIFVAEIPEVIGCDEKIADCKDSGQSVDDLWKYNWNVSPGDELFREMLQEKGYLTKPTYDTPWEWKCWVTNFVKCPCRTHSWQETLKGSKKKTDILDKSARLLAEELEIIPCRHVVLMGRNVQRYFNQYKNKGVLRVEDEKVKKIYHYARKSGNWKRKYRARFRQEVPHARVLV